MYFKKKIPILLLIVILLFNTINLKSKTKNIINLKKTINKNIEKKYIYIKNNLSLIKINKYTGNIEKTKLLKYTKKDKYKNNYPISNNKKKIYKINTQINLKENNKEEKIIFNSYKKIFKKPKYLIIRLESKNNNIKYIKDIILNNNSYKIDILYKLNNNTNKNIKINVINEITQYINKKKNNNNIYYDQNEQNIAYFTKNKKYKNFTFENIKNDIQKNKELNWIAMFEKYFLVTLIPNKTKDTKIFIKKNNDNTITIGYKNIININTKENKYIKNKLWIGPKLIKEINYIEPNLGLTIDYGKFWYITKYLFKILISIYRITNNLGYSIILLTIIIKILVYPFIKIQHQSINKIKKIQPEIEKIKKKYKKNKIKFNIKIIKLYKEKNINPLNGILGILTQIPTFFAVYNIISIPIEFKGANFILWLKDLSSPDKYNFLPIIMGISIYISQKLYVSENEIKKIPIYTKISQTILPITFTILSFYFSSGILIYYITNNIITLIQQEIIDNHYKKNVY